MLLRISMKIYSMLLIILEFGSGLVNTNIEVGYDLWI